MPDIFVHANNKAFHKKLDYLYLNLVKPSIEGVLAKHQLSSRLSFVLTFPESEKSSVFLPDEMAAFAYSDSQDVYKFMLNPFETHIINSHFYSIIQNENIEPNKFRMGHYCVIEDQDLNKNPLSNDFVVVEPSKDDG